VSSPDEPRGDIWGEADNAIRYDAFARRYPMYRVTSRDLVALARLSPRATVLDLACGTGATTAEILSVLGPDGKVVGVDKSPAMLAVAAESVPDRRVTWIQAAAEDVDRHVAGPVDAVVCNSAIWQTDLAATAAAVRTILAAEGRFVFNVGAGFLQAHDDPNDLGRRLSAMREIAARDHGWTPPAEPLRRSPLTRESICRCLGQAGFAVERIEEFSYAESAEAERAWLSIPIFTRNYLPGLPYDDRIRVLAQTYEHLAPGEPQPSRWVAFAARRQDRGSKPAGAAVFLGRARRRCRRPDPRPPRFTRRLTPAP
jgi:SAM-dependent methyltransferase